MLPFLVFACSGEVAREPGAKLSGKTVFFNRTMGGCDVCHRISEKKFVGPGLAGISKRVSGNWLKKWLKNPKEVWKENDPETAAMKKRLGEESKSKPGMRLIRPLTNEEIDALVKYLSTLH
jgi:cytochrome c2